MLWLNLMLFDKAKEGYIGIPCLYATTSAYGYSKEMEKSGFEKYVVWFGRTLNHD